MVYAHQAVRQFEHVVAQRDDNELGVLRLALDVPSNDADVPEIQGRVNLVHKVPHFLNIVPITDTQ